MSFAGSSRHSAGALRWWCNRPLSSWSIHASILSWRSWWLSFYLCRWFRRWPNWDSFLLKTLISFKELNLHLRLVEIVVVILDASLPVPFGNIVSSSRLVLLKCFLMTKEVDFSASDFCALVEEVVLRNLNDRFCGLLALLNNGLVFFS